jgi:hypothetical protein
MPSALPRLDATAGRLVCRRPGCGVTHVPEIDCPPKDVWLVDYFTGIRTPRRRKR